MGFQDLFSQRAAVYATARPDYPAELIAFAASLAPRRGLVWDCATGNGQAAAALAEHFDRVIATDASAQQLAQARVHDRVEYRVARAESSELADGSVDLVTVAQALHWFDLPRFYEEARRVLAPDGALVVWSYDDPALDEPAVDAVLQRFNHETMGAYWPTERAAVGAGYRLLPFPFSEVHAPPFMIERRWTLAELTGYLRSWSAVTRYQASHDDDAVATVEGELALAWGGRERQRLVRWPVIVRAGYRTDQ